eukprot:3951268-Prymnesium_polylepis.1
MTLPLFRFWPQAARDEPPNSPMREHPAPKAAWHLLKMAHVHRRCPRRLQAGPPGPPCPGSIGMV